MTQATHCQLPVTDADVARWEGLVRSLAGSYARGDNEVFEDLCQEGRLCVLGVLPTHDPTLGELATFLRVCIGHAMARWSIKEFRHKTAPVHGINDEGSQGTSSLVLSFDALVEPDDLQCLADHRPQREAEARTQIGLALARAGLTPSEIRALRASLWTGLANVEDYHLKNARQKLRRVMTAGKIPTPFSGRPHSEETKAKIREALLDRKHSGAAKEKMRQKALGRRHSEATKAKMAMAWPAPTDSWS